MATPAELCLWNRATFYQALLIRSQITQLPQDLTGWTVRMEVRKDPGKPLILALATAEASDGAPIAGRITFDTDPTTGYLYLTVAEADTISLPPGSYKYDLRWYDATGRRSVPVEGVFLIKSGITT